MDRSRLNSLFGPEVLGSIYEGTFEFTLRNPDAQDSQSLSHDKIIPINDPLLKKVAENASSAYKHTKQTVEKTQLNKSENAVDSNKNRPKNQSEKTTVPDKSLKRSVDLLIVPLLRLLVQSGFYMTTSSCSGRIVFFEKDKHYQANDNLIFGRSGRILFCSHIQILQNTFQNILALLDSNPKYKFDCYKADHEEEVDERLHESKTVMTDESGVAENEVILKFEPFIVHVQCRNMDAAVKLMNVCKSVGLKQSGISSYGKKIIVAVRGNGSLESPIMIKKYKIENYVQRLVENKHLVNDEYMVYLLNCCNRKMVRNVYQCVKLYHRLKEEFRINKHEFKGSENKKVRHPIGPMCLNWQESSTEYTDLFSQKKIKYRSTFSLPFGVEIPVGVLSFAETSKNLLRTQCCLTSSKRHVVIFGGDEKATSKTICVLDLEKANKGFMVFDIGVEGPEPTKDTDMICDGDVFITHGGMKNMRLYSNDVYVLYVYQDEVGDTGTTWLKCQVKGSKAPKPRHRHSMCLEKRTLIDQGTDLTSSFVCYETKFFVAGGFTTVSEPYDERYIWRCTLTYKLRRDKVSSPVVEWEHLYIDTTDPWISGSLAYHAPSETLYFIGGFRSFYEPYTYDEYMTKIEGLDLKSMKMVKFGMTSTRLVKNGNNGEAQADKDKKAEPYSVSRCFPYKRMTHRLVKLTEDDYLMVGRHASGKCSCEIWYCNLKELVWHKAFDMDSGAICGFGACLVRYEKGNCKHMELWMAGGGVPLGYTFGSVYDPPVRIVLYCNNNCPGNVAHDCGDDWEPICDKDGAKTGSEDEFTDMGMHIVVEDQSALKKIKTLCEHNGVFDKSRKIAELRSASTYFFHYATCSDNSDLKLCSRCYERTRCGFCNCCSSCTRAKYLSASPCFLVPVLRRFEHNELDGAPTFNVFSNAHLSKKRCQNPKKKLLSMLKGKVNEGDVDASVMGTALLITGDLKQHISPSKIDWETVSAEFNVKSVALAGEIEGPKRQRRVEMLYGPEEVSVKENGVTYHFNIAQNMFSKGNSYERIRLVKTYFDQPAKDAVETADSTKSELIVDFFCGIGYFSVPILKYTDKKRVLKILCVDINAEAIKYLNRNCEANAIEKNRIETHIGDCSDFGEAFGANYVDKADRVLLGLLPSSEMGWIPALRALNKKEGGVLHLHGLTECKSTLKFPAIKSSDDWASYVQTNGYPDPTTKAENLLAKPTRNFGLYVLKTFHQFCRTVSCMSQCRWSLEVLHSRSVKHYSPNMYHGVVDLKLTPIPSSS